MALERFENNGGFHSLSHFQLYPFDLHSLRRKDLDMIFPIKVCTYFKRSRLGHSKTVNDKS